MCRYLSRFSSCFYYTVLWTSDGKTISLNHFLTVGLCGISVVGFKENWLCAVTESSVLHVFLSAVKQAHTGCVIKSEHEHITWQPSDSDRHAEPWCRSKVLCLWGFASPRWGHITLWLPTPSVYCDPISHLIYCRCSLYSGAISSLHFIQWYLPDADISYLACRGILTLFGEGLYSYASHCLPDYLLAWFQDGLKIEVHYGKFRNS